MKAPKQEATDMPKTRQPRSTYLGSPAAVKKEIGRVYDKVRNGAATKEQASEALHVLKECLAILEPA